MNIVIGPCLGTISNETSLHADMSVDDAWLKLWCISGEVQPGKLLLNV